MRGKQLNSGIRGGLWEDEHLQRMGPAVWLFGWLVHRQTRERHGVGLVLGGSPMTYEIISQDTGMCPRTLKRWMKRLIDAGYVRVTHTTHKRMIIEITKAKKFGPQQLRFPQTEAYFPQAPFFAPKSKVPHPALEVASKVPIVALQKGEPAAELTENTTVCASAPEKHRESKPERKETEAANQSVVQPRPHSVRPAAGRGRPPSRPFATRYQPDWKTLRDLQLHAELRVGAGPEIHRE